MSELEETFAYHLRLMSIDGYEREYRFAAEAVGGTGKGLRHRLQEAKLHDWRFDFAWPRERIAVELEGGTWTGGRHVQGAGFEEDCRKSNAAQMLGWRVLRFTTNMVTSGEALAVLIPMLNLDT